MTRQIRRAGPIVGALLAIFLTAGAATAQDDALSAGVRAYWNEDFDAAAGHWRDLAEAGDPLAQFNMGILHDNRPAETRDPAEAMVWYRKAAEAGDARAAFNLGLMHEEGDGTEADVAKAVSWYERAAEAGDLLAQHRLGLILGEGRGNVAEDQAAAARWLLLAAESGHVPSMFALVGHYTEGRGVERDLIAANRWGDRAGVMMMFTEGTICGLGRSAELIEECRRVTPRHRSR